MRQDEFKTRKLKNEEAAMIARILSSGSTGEIQDLTSTHLLDYLSRNPNPEAIKRIVDIVHKQIEILRFDEFKDKALADWKRVRSAIEHENTLVNHRLTWLLTSQGFLFTGFGVVYSSKNDKPLDLYGMAILIVIAIVGMAISLKIFIDIESAAKQLLDLDCWWHKTYAPKEYEDPLHTDDIKKRRAASERLKRWHPDLQRRGDRKMFWLDKGLKVEITFLVAWLVILSGVIAKPFSGFSMKPSMSTLMHCIACQFSLH